MGIQVSTPEIITWLGLRVPRPRDPARNCLTSESRGLRAQRGDVGGLPGDMPRGKLCLAEGLHGASGIAAVGQVPLARR